MTTIEIEQQLQDITDILAIYAKDWKSLQSVIALLRAEADEQLTSSNEEALLCVYNYWENITSPIMLYASVEPWDDTLNHHYLHSLLGIAQQWHIILTTEETQVKQDLLLHYQLKLFSKPILSREAFAQQLALILKP